MLKKMEHPRKMDDLGGKPTIFGNIHILATHFFGGSVLHTIFRTFLQNHLHISSIVGTYADVVSHGTWTKLRNPIPHSFVMQAAASASAAGRQEARPESCRTVEENASKPLSTSCYPTESGPATRCSKLPEGQAKSEIGTTGISHQEIQVVMHWTQGAHHADLIQMWLDFRQANIC